MAGKSGYAIQKAKNEKLEKQVSTLKESIYKLEEDVKAQANLIKNLQEQISAKEACIFETEASMQRTIDEMYKHMGCFRRFLWNIMHEDLE